MTSPAAPSVTALIAAVAQKIGRERDRMTAAVTEARRQGVGDRDLSLLFNEVNQVTADDLLKAVGDEARGSWYYYESTKAFIKLNALSIAVMYHNNIDGLGTKYSSILDAVTGEIKSILSHDTTQHKRSFGERIGKIRVWRETRTATEKQEHHRAIAGQWQDLAKKGLAAEKAHRDKEIAEAKMELERLRRKKAFETKTQSAQSELYAKRVGWATIIDFAKTKNIATSLNLYVSAANKIEDALREVEKNQMAATAEEAKRAEMRKALATGLFKMIHQYAPPPFNLAGGIVLGAAAIGMKALELAAQNIGGAVKSARDTPLDISDLAKTLQEKAIEKAGEYESRHVTETPTNIKEMMDARMKVAQRDFAKVVDASLASRNLHDLTEGFQRRRADSIVANALGRTGPQDAGAFLADRATHLSPVDMVGLDDKIRAAVAEHGVDLARLQTDLTKISGTIPSGDLPADFDKLMIWFIFGLELVNRLEENRKTNKEYLPDFTEAEIKFLEKHGLIKLENSDLVKPPFGYKTHRVVISGSFINGHKTSRFALTKFLHSFATSGNTPFRLLFDQNYTRADMDRFFEDTLTDIRRITEEVISDANRQGFFTVKTSYRGTEYAKRL